jgi:hypothetical protein
MEQEKIQKQSVVTERTAPLNVPASAKSTASPEPPKQAPSSKGSFLKRFWYFLVIGLIILLLAAVWGFFYLQTSKHSMTKEGKLTTSGITPTPVVEADSQTKLLQEQSSSDEISAIEADLEETDLAGLDQELTSIESELVTP